MRPFTINFDYRCPFARNANEHVLAGLEAGAAWDVRFVAFSLTAAHAEPGDENVWKDPAQRPNLTALAAGIAVRDRFSEVFRPVHRALFAARHDDGNDLRDEAVVRSALERGGADADAVFAELASGWPYEVVRSEHELSVIEQQAFGVPTFGVGDAAVFVRLMTRPQGDGTPSIATIERVLALIEDHPELNEFKHTSISR